MDRVADELRSTSEPSLGNSSVHFLDELLVAQEIDQDLIFSSNTRHGGVFTKYVLNAQQIV